MDNRISNNVNFRALHLPSKEKLIKAVGKKEYAKIERVIPKLQAQAKDCDIYLRPVTSPYEDWVALGVKVKRQVKSPKDFFVNLMRKLNPFNTTGEMIIFPDRTKKGMANDLVDILPKIKEEALK